MDRATADKLLRLIGLGVRSRGVVVGVEQVREAAKANKLAFAVVAPDASEHSRAKVLPLLNARRVRFVEGPTAAQLGAAAGREQTAAVGITDRHLARGIRQLVDASVGGTP
jgi:ribosomal protein L7Ae-like RNA K-turn-binding protein